MDEELKAWLTRIEAKLDAMAAPRNDPRAKPQEPAVAQHDPRNEPEEPLAVDIGPRNEQLLRQRRERDNFRIKQRQEQADDRTRPGETASEAKFNEEVWQAVAREDDARKESVPPDVAFDPDGNIQPKPLGTGFFGQPFPEDPKYRGPGARKTPPEPSRSPETVQREIESDERIVASTQPMEPVSIPPAPARAGTDRLSEFKRTIPAPVRQPNQPMRPPRTEEQFTENRPSVPREFQGSYDYVPPQTPRSSPVPVTNQQRNEIDPNEDFANSTTNLLATVVTNISNMARRMEAMETQLRLTSNE